MKSPRPAYIYRYMLNINTHTRSPCRADKNMYMAFTSYTNLKTDLLTLVSEKEKNNLCKRSRVPWSPTSI